MSKFFNLYKIAGVICAFIFAITSVVVAQQGNTNSSDISEPLLEDVTARQLHDIVNSYKGDKAVLINIWATWCAPCIEEIPDIIKLQRNYSDELKVIFVSADFSDNRDQALEFLKDQGVDWTTYFKTGDDQEFIEKLSGKWTGALPFTKIIGTDGEVVDSWEQSASYETFEKHIKTAINR